MYSYLIRNSYIETDIQKGFWTRIYGTIEYTGDFNLTNLIITLLDLMNTFGELDHRLINSILRYHHVPNHISSLVGSFYTIHYSILVGTSDFITNLAVVQKRVLQRDSLSPLNFNMCFNTLIRSIENEKIKLLGYNYTNALSPCVPNCK